MPWTLHMIHGIVAAAAHTDGHDVAGEIRAFIVALESRSVRDVLIIVVDLIFHFLSKIFVTASGERNEGSELLCKCVI